MTVTPLAGLVDGTPHPMTAFTTDNRVVEVPFTVTAP